MAVLIHEDDDGTEIHQPRLSDDDAAVIVDVFRDGNHVAAATYSFQEWVTRFGALIGHGFRVVDERPDLRASINAATRELVIAGFAPTVLDRPGETAGAPGNPEEAEPLVIQADDKISDAGYLRMTQWWRIGDELVTTIVPSVKPGYLHPVLTAVRGEIGAAVIAIRTGINPQDTEQARDWVMLCHDPYEAGFTDRAMDASRRHGDTPVGQALQWLFLAVNAAYAGDAQVSMDACQTAVRLVGGG